jgi:hypothetical protein
VVLAELEIFHSRAIAPTRRVALGRRQLPVDPAPGYGGLLLGGVVAAHVGGLEADLVPDLIRLTHELEDGRRIPQPRLRHRLQVDHVGLQLSVHRLVGVGDNLDFVFDHGKGHPAQQLLGAVYAAGEMPRATRHAVFATVRRAIGWNGPVGPDLIATLAGFGRGRSLSAQAFGDPVAWALDVLGFVNGDRPPPSAPAPSRREVQRRFRDGLRTAHPDHGGASAEAAQRIADLTEARRILIG